MASESLTVRLDAQTGSLDSALQTTSNKLDKLGSKTKVADKNLSQFSRRSGMAGIQFQQFIGQIQGGQSAMVALSQQSADLGFVLGAPLLGAVAGISASVIGMAVAFANSGEKVEDFTFSIDEMAKSLEKVAKLTRAQLRVGLLDTTKQLKQIDEQSEVTGNKIFALSEKLNEGAKDSITFSKGGKAILDSTKLTTEEVKKLSEELDREKANLDTLNTSKADQLKLQKEINAILSGRPSTTEATEAETEALKKKNDALKKGNELANVGVSFADVGAQAEVIERDRINEIKLEQERAFLLALDEINFTGEETKQEMFDKEVELHKAMLDAKFINEEQFAKAQENSVKKLVGKQKTLAKTEKQIEIEKLNIKQSSIRAGMAVAALAFEDNKAIGAGLVVADTAVGIQKSLAINPYDYGNVALIAATGAVNLANVLSASKGGGSLSSGVSGSAEQPQAQEEFSPDTATQGVSFTSLGDESSTGNGAITFNAEGGSSADDAMAVYINDAVKSGRVSIRGNRNDIGN